jgi:hypothetical protein
MKDQRIVILVDEDEKADFEARATEKGFDTVAAYIRWLVRKDS